jgi:type VI protein secretion system component VasK
MGDPQTIEQQREKRRLPPPYLRRRPRGLLWFWMIGLAAAGVLFWTAWKLPALSDLLRPGYWVIGILLAVFTIRWFRPRTGRRRHGERRRADRRDDPTATDS